MCRAAHLTLLARGSLTLPVIFRFAQLQASQEGQLDTDVSLGLVPTFQSARRNVASWCSDLASVACTLCSLDYNLDRFAYEDRKGLELVLLSSLFAILQGDKLDEHTKPSTDQAVNASLAGSANGTSIPSGPGNLKRQDSDEVETVRSHAWPPN